MDFDTFSSNLGLTQSKSTQSRFSKRILGFWRKHVLTLSQICSEDDYIYSPKMLSFNNFYLIIKLFIVSIYQQIDFINKYNSNQMLKGRKKTEQASQKSETVSIDKSKVVQREQFDESKQQGQPSLLLYQLRKLLNQSSERQEKYINFIKQQKEQIFLITEKYSEAMSKYEKEIKGFITKKQEEKSTKRFEKVHRLAVKNPPNQYNKIQYTLDSEYQLNCRIKFQFIAPVIEDYLKQSFPSKLAIQLTQYYPSREKKIYFAQLNPELDQEEIVERVKNGYSIQIYSPESKIPSYNFLLSYFQQNIEKYKLYQYFKNYQLQIFLRNEFTQLLLGTGKIDLEQFLQFNPGIQQTWVDKIPIYSIDLDGPRKIIAFLHIQNSNIGIQRKITHEHIHKVSEPITLNKHQIKLYSDKESRIIQRINQFKNVHNSVIPSITKDTNQKNIIMHNKRKELQQISHYKQINKNQYMDKIFIEAIQKFNTVLLDVGKCKYIPFIYTNQTQRHQKAKITVTQRLLNQAQDHPNQQFRKTSHEDIYIQVVEPTSILALLQQNLIEYPEKAQNCTIDYSFENGQAFIVNGESIIIFVKVICHSLNLAKYELALQLSNDFGQQLYKEISIIKTILPVPNHIFEIYSYNGQVNEMKMEIPSYIGHSEGFDLIGKSKILNIISNQQYFEIENKWSADYEILQLKIKTSSKAPLSKSLQFYLAIYDTAYYLQLAIYQFQIECVQRIEEQRIDLGRTYTFNTKFRVPSSSGNPIKVEGRVGTSDYLQTSCEAFNFEKKTKSFLVQQNVDQLITINYNTFNENPNREKIVISCVNPSNRKVLKKMILVLNKNPSSYKSIYHVLCPTNQPFLYNFELSCNQKEQTTYKLYSSNYSLLAIQQNTIVMFTGQRKTIKLTLKYWSSQNTIVYNTEQEIRSVVMGVDDGKSCSLYLFEMEPEN